MESILLVNTAVLPSMVPDSDQPVPAATQGFYKWKKGKH